MRIPEIQRGLRSCAEELRRIGNLIDNLTNELDRRKPVTRAKNGSKRMTPAMAKQARLLAASGLAQHDIATQLGVNPGRVSEAIHGRRQ